MPELKPEVQLDHVGTTREPSVAPPLSPQATSDPPAKKKRGWKKGRSRRNYVPPPKPRKMSKLMRKVSYQKHLNCLQSEFNRLVGLYMDMGYFIYSD